MTEDKLLANERSIAVPGEEIAEGLGFIPGEGVYRKENKLIAGRLGLVSTAGKVLKLIPLSGKYIPKINDKIIGKVFDVLMTGWRLDMNSPYSSVLTLKDASSEFIERGADLTQFYNIGDYIMAKITNVTSQKLVDVTMRGPGLRKLKGGRIIEVNTHKVPRIIGKEGSMVGMIKEHTGCNILVGQNGLIWIDGSPEHEVLAVKAITKIAEESHTSNLTERIKTFLEEQIKVIGKPTIIKTEPEPEFQQDNGGYQREERYDRGERRSFDRNRPPRRQY